MKQTSCHHHTDLCVFFDEDISADLGDFFSAVDITSTSSDLSFLSGGELDDGEDGTLIYVSHSSKTLVPFTT